MNQSSGVPVEASPDDAQGWLSAGITHSQSPGLEAALSPDALSHSRQGSISLAPEGRGRRSSFHNPAMSPTSFIGGMGVPAPEQPAAPVPVQPADPEDQMVSVKLSTLQKMQDELTHVMSTRGKTNQELAETQVKLLESKKERKSLKAELDEALMHVGELAEGLELAENELDMLRPLEDNRSRGLVSTELDFISSQLEKKFVMVGIECDEEMQLLKPKLREMEAVSEELYEQVDILKRELAKANKLLGRDDPLLLELEAERHTALDKTREEIAVLREKLEEQAEVHDVQMMERRRASALKILQRISRRYIHQDSICAIRTWKEAQTGDQVASMKMSCSMISQLWRKMDRMSERAIEQESSVDGWREAVRTQETRVAVLTAHSSQLEDQLSRYQSSNVTMSDQTVEKDVKIQKQAEQISELKLDCTKTRELEQRIVEQEAEISTLIARLNRELRFSSANDDAVAADDQRMTQLSNRVRVQEAELANLNTIESLYKMQLEKSSKAKDEFFKLKSELSEAEVGKRTAETRAKMIEVELNETNGKIDKLQVSRQTLHQSQTDATGLREECSRAASALSRCQEDRDSLEAQLKEIRKNSDLSGKQVKRLQMLESLHDQDETHIKAQKAENDRLQNVEKQLKGAQMKLDSTVEPLASLPALEATCKERKGRISALESQVAELGDVQTKLQQSKLRESKLQKEVAVQAGELAKAEACWEKIKLSEQDLSKKEAEITRLENVDGDLAAQRTRETQLAKEVEKLKPFRDKCADAQTELHRLKQESEEHDAALKKEQRQIQDQMSKMEKREKSALEQVDQLELNAKKIKQQTVEQAAKGEEDRRLSADQAAQKVKAANKQTEQSDGELRKIASELKVLKDTDMYREMDAAKSRAAKLQKDVEGLRRDQMRMTGDQGALLAANNQIVELEEQLSKLELTKARVVELETQLERVKAGAMLEDGNKFDSLNKASQRYKDTLVASDAKPRWSDPGSAGRHSATSPQGESLAATPARMLGKDATQSQDRAAKSQARAAAAAKRDKETTAIKERAAAAARQDAETRKAARNKAGKAKKGTGGDLTTRSTRSLEEQMDAYWGKGKKKGNQQRRNSIDDTTSRNNNTQAASTPDKTSAEWWGKPRLSSPEPRTMHRSQSTHAVGVEKSDQSQSDLSPSELKSNPQEVVAIGLAEWAGAAVRNSVTPERQTSPSRGAASGSWEWSAGVGSGSGESGSRDTSPSPATLSRSPSQLSRSSRDNWGSGWGSPDRSSARRSRESREHSRPSSQTKTDDLTDLKAQIAQINTSTRHTMENINRQAHRLHKNR